MSTTDGGWRVSTMDGRWKVEGEHSGTMEGEEVTTLSKGMFGVGSVRTVWAGTEDAEEGERRAKKDEDEEEGKER